MAKTIVENTTTSTKRNGSVIKECSCKHEYQDERYGKGKRVCCVTHKSYRCTVCGYEGK